LTVQKYLKDLGITIIYFNPLVQAASNHKYEAFDYFKIDPHFGTNKEFIKLVKELHQNGIRVIVDFAFNHVGVGFFAFQDCVEKGEKSKYYNWFDWHKWPLPDKIPEDFDAKIDACSRALNIAKKFDKPYLANETVVVRSYVKLAQAIYLIAEQLVHLPNAALAVKRGIIWIIPIHNNSPFFHS